MSTPDMFHSQPLPQCDQYGNETKSSSCPITMKFHYGYVILFNWCVKAMKPFKMFPRRTFSNQEISDYWMENNVEDQYRIKKLKPLRTLPGEKMSLFAKVESCKYLSYYYFLFFSIIFCENIIGCDSRRKEVIVDYLNDNYQEILKEKKTILESYSDMVKNNPYRVLASYSYDWDEKPLRSDRIARNPGLLEPTIDSSLADKTSPFVNISTSSEHYDFIQLIINAKTMAEINDSSASIWWKGYNTLITPDFKITRDSLKEKLLSVLRNVPNPAELTELEKKVIILLLLI